MPTSPLPTVWTIGHSSRPIDEFLAMLAAQDIRRLADVRRFAGSRTHPQFSPDPLAGSLADAGIEYLPLPALGGRRTPRPDSRNTVWRNKAFQGYADYMETPAFRAGLAHLVDAASGERTAMMCSEAVWWRCHRSMIADALKAEGGLVLHIMGLGKVTEHPYTAPAHVEDGVLTYGPAEG